MKILYLATHLNMGGITKYLYLLSKEIIAQGHEVHIITSGGDMEDEFAALGVKHKRFRIKTKSELSLKLILAARPIKKYILANDIDVIHAQTRVTQVLAHRISRSLKKPYVSTCHGFFKPRLSRKMFPCWGRCAIAISQPVKDHLFNDLGVNKNIIRLVESGIDLYEFAQVTQEQRAQARERLHLNDEPVIGIIARLSEVKGQDVLLWAMCHVIELFPNAKLLIVGQGKTEAQLKELVHKLKLDDNVIFHPVVHKIQDFLAAMDVFVMPSRQEGLGLSVLEAQAVGIPVVASNVGGLPMIVKNKLTGLLVESENADQLSQAIINILKHKKEAQKLVKTARQVVEERFSSTRMATETLSVYRRFIR